jgi:peptidoglycan L-alanyl-D-glutamate endopeptidase CwlK
MTPRDEKRLAGVHADLVRVVRRAGAMSQNEVTVIEGLRTLARQKALYEAGATTTFRSRHLTGHAVDLAVLVPFCDGDGDGDDDDGIFGLRWDWPLYHKLGATVKEAARDLRIPIEWGGDWKVFKDGPHFQLPWKEYPEANR